MIENVTYNKEYIKIIIYISILNYLLIQLMCDFVMFIWLSSFIIEGIACAVYPVSNPWPTGDHAADNVAKS